MYTQYIELKHYINRYKGFSQQSILLDVMSNLSRRENAPIISYLGDDISLDDYKDNTRYQKNGMLVVNKSEESKFDKFGNLTENLELKFIGSDIGQMYRTVDLINITGLGLMFLTKFDKKPKGNQMFI